jgi:hypothetical protein
VEKLHRDKKVVDVDFRINRMSNDVEDEYTYLD